MTLRRLKNRSAAVMAIAAGMFLTAPAALGQQEAYKLEGAWIANLADCPGQISYVLSADSSGRRASGHGSIEVGFSTGAVFGPAFAPIDYTSPLLISVVMTKPDTASFYAVWYGVKKLAAPSPLTAQIVYIAVNTGEFKLVGPGKMETTHNFAFYYPAQDADGDGFPDDGETTPYAFQRTSVDTRLPLPE
jgi:hypothetical protein